MQHSRNTIYDEKTKNHTKKKTKSYRERDEIKRKEYKNIIKQYDTKTIYYIDETGIDRYYQREYGYALKGEKIYSNMSGRKFKRIGIVSAEQNGKFIAPMQYEGTMDSSFFEGWFSDVFLKEIPENSVIVMDNASFHCKPNLFDLASAHKCILYFLPPYSPDLNPIEKMWANLKSFLSSYSHNFSLIQSAISAFFNKF